MHKRRRVGLGLAVPGLLVAVAAGAGAVPGWWALLVMATGLFAVVLGAMWLNPPKSRS